MRQRAEAQADGGAGPLAGSLPGAGPIPEAWLSGPGGLLLRQRGHLFPWAPVALACGICLYFSLAVEPAGQAVLGAALLAVLLAALAIRLSPAVSPLVWALALVAAGLVLAAARAQTTAAPVLGWRYYGAVEGRVIGIDMTQDMIDLARSNAGKLGLSNTEFYHAEMERTPVDDDTADILISNCVINLAPDKDAVFREAFRVLKPGGRLMVSDMVLMETLPEEQATDTSNWVACLAGAELKSVYLGRIADAGFADVEVVSETHLESGDGWRSSVRSMNIKATKPPRDTAGTDAHRGVPAAGRQRGQPARERQRG